MLLCNDASHWLGPSLESAMENDTHTLSKSRAVGLAEHQLIRMMDDADDSDIFINHSIVCNIELAHNVALHWPWNGLLMEIFFAILSISTCAILSKD